MSHDIGKPIFVVCDQRPAQLQRLAIESWNFGFRNLPHYTIYAANNKDFVQNAQMRWLICVYVVRIWQNDNRSLRTQIISYPSHFVPLWLFRTYIYFQFSHFVPSLVTSSTRFVSTITWIRVVSTTIPFAPESFRPFSLSPWVVSPPNRFVNFSVRPCVVSPTVASRVDSPPYKFCFGLLIGVKHVLFEILSYKQWAMNSVSDAYIHFQSWHR